MTTPVLTTAGIRARVPGSITGHPLIGALSPSRASDFMTCPLLYRFRAIDRLPERPGRAALRGTLVHEVLDRLFDVPAQERGLEVAAAMLPAALDDLLTADPDAAFALADDAPWPGPTPELDEQALKAMRKEARALLRTYFTMEDPSSLEPLHREQLVETQLEPGLVLRGYVDRIDDADGALRVVDYKTGRSPGAQWEQAAMFQLRFYALIVHLDSGRLPQRLQLLYLGNGEVLTYEPDAEDLRRFERKLRALWEAITRAAEQADWRANPSRKCGWCSHQQLCPAFGGTPPPVPDQPGGRVSLTVEQ
jgi:putative RecB family exonuclease